MEYYMVQMEINMKLNGKMINLMNMENIIFILLIGNIKENGKMYFLMDFKLYIFLKD